MAFTTILRRSASTITPIALRFAHKSNLKNSNHVAILTALYHTSPLTRMPTSISGHVCSPTCHHYSSMVAPMKPTSDHSLIKVLESEIQCAEEADDHDGVEETPTNFPFEIQDIPGQQTITLTSRFQGETIKVDVHMPDLVTGEDGADNDDNDADSENGGQSSIPLVVQVSKKNGLSLEFSVIACPDEIAIESLVIKDPENSEDQIAYEGPDFSDLDENLQKAFHKYLEIRGIKPSVTNFLHEYMINKDSREYSLWLKNLKQFVAA